nr:hypothetical protein [uncultured Prevotella sp.]
MKKFILALVAMVTMTCTTASAMSYEQARQQALFLTDKMAYELNLTDDQYEAAYEVNLDYLMGVNTYDDLYGIYWRQRNMDLNYILLDWQYQAYLNATYFYRPLYWNAGYFHFGIYARYPRRDYFFFGRPHFYASYRGAHCWRMNGGRSWYHGREFGRPRPGGQPRMGMRDGFNRGDYGRGKTFGNMNRPSSTRTTVTNDRKFGNSARPNGSFNNNARPNGSFGNSNRSNSSVFGGNRSFGNGSNSNSRPSRSFTPRSSSPSSSFGTNRGGGSFGGSSRSSNNTRSFGGGGSSHSSGGSNGGGHFGNRR